MIHELRVNSRCYGELPSGVQKLMGVIGFGYFEWRTSEGWRRCCKHGQFLAALTYRLSDDFKTCIRLDYKEYNGIWCVCVNGELISYDSSVSIVAIDGEAVRFLGFSYDGVTFIGDMLGPDGQLPRCGMWKIL